MIKYISFDKFNKSIDKVKNDKLYNNTIQMIIVVLSDLLKPYTKNNGIYISREEFQNITTGILDKYEKDKQFFIICTMLAMLDYELFTK